MKIHAYGRLFPLAKFGVPDEDAIVFKSGKDSKVFSPSFMSGSLVVTGWGSMPRYRTDDEALDIIVNFCDVELKLQDNYFMATIDGSDLETGRSRIKSVLEVFVNALSVVDTSPFKFRIDMVHDDNNNFHTPPKPYQVQFRAYDLVYLSDHIKKASILASRSNEILDRSVFYYNLALATLDIASTSITGKWKFYTALTGSALLNLYKATTVIVGDPSISGDGHQKRSNDLNFDSHDKKVFSEIKMFRDSYDIAHYSLEPKKLEDIHTDIEKYKQFVSTIIQRYAEIV